VIAGDVGRANGGAAGASGEEHGLSARSETRSSQCTEDPIESVCPRKRIVPKVPDATPSCDLGTEPITAEVLGELNADMPIPATTRQPTRRNMLG